MPQLQSLSIRRHPRKKSENALSKNLHSLLDGISHDTPARRLVNPNPKKDLQFDLEIEKDSLIEEEAQIIVQTDSKKLVEESIFQMVLEMERQFDDIQEDLDQIKKERSSAKSQEK